MNFGRYLVRHNRIGLLGALILLGFTLVALFPSFFAPHDPLEMYAEARLVPPTFEFPMGTDRFGREHHEPYRLRHPHLVCGGGDGGVGGDRHR